MKSDIDIAQGATLRPIVEVAAGLGLDEEDLDLYGKYKAKIHLDCCSRVQRAQPRGRLVLCTAINATPAGEGKTTTNIGLSMALNRLGKKAVSTLREPSLGPSFGVKGGAAGGGYAQVVPMEDINLHFTGDIHAVTAAHNLCAAMLDNHLFQGNALDIDLDRISWPRVLDANDRALRKITIGQNGEGVRRESRFDITAASEVMAILCLASDLEDLKARLARIVLAWNSKVEPVTADDLQASGAMAVLMRDAFMPNLVQTLDNTPCIMHGGPFGNVAHGCNSIQALEMALRLGDYCVTEAGFGADLGAEKFFNIVSRCSGLVPDSVVIVATVRAVKMHGGVALSELKDENLDALRRGIVNLEKHLEDVRLFGLPSVVAINRFPTDTESELQLLQELVADLGEKAIVSDVWDKGAEGGLELAEEVIRISEGGERDFRQLYDLELPLRDKIERIATLIYGADGVDYTPRAEEQLDRYTLHGYGDLPICMAKTQFSLSDDKDLIGRPTGWRLTVRALRLSAGAGFVVPVCGKMMTMFGLPKHPAAEQIDLVDARIVGLF